jgi:hypothetical protein
MGDLLIDRAAELGRNGDEQEITVSNSLPDITRKRHRRRKNESRQENFIFPGFQ